MTLGDIINKYRTEHDLSMGQFSELSSISKAYISLLEKNRHPSTGMPIAPTIQTIKLAADAMNMDFNKLFSMIDSDVRLEGKRTETSVKVKVYGRVAAGIPMEMIEDIYDEEEIPMDWTRGGKEYFGLVIHGESMQPKMSEGDVVIARKQPNAESGDTVIATVNGYEATCKVLKKYPHGIELVPTNPTFDRMFYTNEEIESLPVNILGKVVELRVKY